MEGASIGHSKTNEEEYALLSSEFQISSAAAQGGRKYMEDRLQIEVRREPNGGLDFIFAAVYDGHGGVQASDYTSRHLFQNIVNNQDFYSNNDNEVMGAIRSGFLRTQLDMQKVAEQWPPTSTGFPCTAGTTATCAFIRNGKLYTGHVGDSSIILANFMEDEQGYNDAKLTEDHKPESKAEQNRIEKAGGAIASKSGIFRVIWKRPTRGHRGPIRRSTSTENIPFLAVARSLGDFWSFNPDNNQFVISPDPDVDVFRLKQTDNFIVIASDGLTNVLTVSSIIEILRDEKKAAALPFADGGNKNEQHNPVNYAHSLLQNSFKKWGSLRADNISIICVKLNVDKMPEGHPSIAAEEGNINGKMDIAQQLIQHPYSMIHVNSKRTFRLNTHPIRHLYTGSMDKGMNLQQPIRFGPAPNVDRNCNHQKATTNSPGEGYFVGPGFIVPDTPNKEFAANGGGIVNVNWKVVGNNASSSLLASYKGSIDIESDAEEGGKNGMHEKGKEEGELEVEISTKQIATMKKTRKPEELIAKETEQYPPEGNKASEDIIEITGKMRHLPVEIVQNDGILQQKMCTQQQKEQTMNTFKVPFIRTGLKRRLQESEDGYIRHMPGISTSLPSSSTSLSPSKKLCHVEEEQQEEEEEATLKPPPAKRSKLQTVFNFFTNLFKW